MTIEQSKLESLEISEEKDNEKSKILEKSDNDKSYAIARHAGAQNSGAKKSFKIIIKKVQTS